MTTLEQSWLTLIGIVCVALIGALATLAAKWMEIGQARVTTNNNLADSIRDDLDKERTSLKGEVQELKSEIQELRKEMQGLIAEIKEHQTGREIAEKECRRLEKLLVIEQEKNAVLVNEQSKMISEINVLRTANEIHETAERTRIKYESKDEKKGIEN